MTELKFVDFSTGQSKEFKDDRFYRDREDYAQLLFSELGFDAFQTRSSFDLKRKLQERLQYQVFRRFLESHDVKKDELFVTGVPDLLVLNSYGVMFVEVKSFKDGLRKSQVEWMLKFEDKLDVKILYIE